MQATALLCDHAQVSSDGKLYVAGANITRLFTPNAEPPLAVNISLAVIIQIDWTETNAMHRFSIELIYDDPTGAQLVTLPIDLPPGAPAEAEGRFMGEFNAGRGPDMQPGEETLMPLALNLAGLQLPAPGSYYFVVKIDDTERARCSFRATAQSPMMTGFGR